MGNFYELDVCICKPCMARLKKLKLKTVDCVPCYICDNVVIRGKHYRTESKSAKRGAKPLGGGAV